MNDVEAILYIAAQIVAKVFFFYIYSILYNWPLQSVLTAIALV